MAPSQESDEPAGLDAAPLASGKSDAARPRLMAIVPADYDALKNKGVEQMLLERDEGGFFERVVTVHPVAWQTRTMRFGETHVLYEFGLDRFGTLARRKVFRWCVFVAHFMLLVPGLIAVARRERVSLVRANDPYWMGLLGCIVSRACGIPLGVSIHADYEKRHQLTGGGATYTAFGLRWPARLLSRLVLRAADLVMPIRETLGKWAVANGARSERVRVIPHGIDLSPFGQEPDPALRAELGIPSGRKVVSFVGRPSRENYIYEVLEAARLLAAKRDDFVLVLAGGGDEESRIREQIRQDPSLNAVVLPLGFQPRAICIQLRLLSAVSLCPMGGFSLIEACASGSPVVSYDVEWHSELIRSGASGFLLPEHDVAGMADAVAYCLDHPEDARRLGSAARQLAWERHDMGKASAVKRACYAQLLGGPS